MTAVPQSDPASAASGTAALFGDVVRGSIAEVKGTIARWRIVHLMGSAELRRRYARSRLGQLWLTLYMAAFVLAVGTFWSQILREPAESMVPHLAIGQIIWFFLSGSIVESTSAFPAHAWVLNNQYMPTGVIVASVIYRNMLIFMYNSVIILAIILFFGLISLTGIALFLVFFALTCIMLYCACYIIAIICVRFRDVIQIVSTIMTALMFFTPIFWKEKLLPPDLLWLVNINPFANIMIVLRNPLMQEPLRGVDLAIFFGMLAAAIIVAGVVVGRLRHRIIFWV